MKGRWFVLLMVLWMVLSLPGLGNAEAGWDVQRTFDLQGTVPLDVEVSATGQWVFVLNDQEEILVFSPYGKLKDRISVGKSIDAIEPGPVDDMLVISSRKEKTLEIITIDLVQTINVSDAPYKGPADAPITMAAFTDLQSPVCAELAPVLDRVLGKYPEKVKLVFKNFPLKRQNPFAGRAAVAAMAAEKQGKFWEFYDLIFADSKGLNQEKIEGFAGKIGMDLEKFKNDMRDPRMSSKIQQDISEGIAAGVKMLPAVFINGKKVRNPTLEGIEASIEKELEKLKGRGAQS